MSASVSRHVPVLIQQVLQLLDVREGSTVVDGTLGGGGHTRMLAEHVGPQGTVLALDRDPDAVQRARELFSDSVVQVLHADYSDLPNILVEQECPKADAILLDVGLSSDQLDDHDRGFSFDSDGPLDLRFDPTEGEPASQIVNYYGDKRLADLIYQLGEERFSRRIARRIVEERKKSPIRTSAELAQIVRHCVPRSRGHRIDPATRTFQALRIAVNDELGRLERALQVFPTCLTPNGRVAVISFHSLEDRLVKHTFRNDPHYEVLTKKPVRPEADEIAQNPRSRSAKLRVAQLATDYESVES